MNAHSAAKVGAALAIGLGTGLSARGESLVPWPSRVRTAFPAVIGSIAGAASLAVPAVVRLTPRRALVVLATAGTLGGATAVVAKGQLGKLAASGRSFDTQLEEPPAASVHPYVSGGTDSLVAYATVGREGARFIHSRTTDADSESCGITRTAEPVRVFVGVDSADSIQGRVSLAIAELHRTGGFDREYLVVQAPAGSGYANSTPIDVVEILSGGDCASVVVGYGVLPSFLSLSKIELAGETQLALLNAVSREIERRKSRGLSVPKVLLYGESLGAKVQQYALALGSSDLDRYAISRALWVGTPGGKDSDAFHQLTASESITVDQPGDVPASKEEQDRLRVWFLEHHGDPVVRFRSEISWQQPAWLSDSEPRGRNIPQSMTWTPVITWATVLVDTMFATDVKPGDFQSFGHDYRADLAGVASAAFGFFMTPAEVEQLDAQLRVLEVRRAQSFSSL